MSLTLDKISKSLGDRLILDQFSIKFKPGSITCLFGPSGCGKTTLLNLIGGIFPVDRGIISGFSEERISYIFQDTRILPWKTVLENVVFPLIDQMPYEHAVETAKKFIRLVGLEKEDQLFPSQLSGGMKQRVSIARAFAFPGSLILMDEAFQSLDNNLKYNILDSFLEIWKEDGRTVIFVTHDIDEAIRLGEEIVFLSRSPMRIIRTVHISNESQEKVRSFVKAIYNQ